MNPIATAIVGFIVGALSGMLFAKVRYMLLSLKG